MSEVQIFILLGLSAERAENMRTRSCVPNEEQIFIQKTERSKTC